MHNKIILFCPTRSRLKTCLSLTQNIEATKTKDLVDVVFILDDDDPQLQEYITSGLKILIIKNEKPGLVYPLNMAYKQFKDLYTVYGFMGDDVSFHTQGWDKIFYDYLDHNNFDRVVYGNDMLRGDCLLTSFFIGHKFLDKIGYMAYPELNHVFVDTFWRLVAGNANKLTYFPNVIIKHDHYTINPNTKYDVTYQRTMRYNNSDHQVYSNFEKTKLKETVALLA